MLLYFTMANGRSRECHNDAIFYNGLMDGPVSATMMLYFTMV